MADTPAPETIRIPLPEHVDIREVRRIVRRYVKNTGSRASSVRIEEQEHSIEMEGQSNG